MNQSMDEFSSLRKSKRGLEGDAYSIPPVFVSPGKTKDENSGLRSNGRRGRSQFVFTALDGRVETTGKSQLTYEIANSVSNFEDITNLPSRPSFNPDSLPCDKDIGAGILDSANEIKQRDFSIRQVSLPSFSPLSQSNSPVRMSVTPRSRLRTPVVLQKDRTPISGKQTKLKAVIKLKALENQETEASCQEDVKRQLWLEKQDKAYRAWLNHVLTRPMRTGVQLTKVASETGSLASKESNDSSLFSSVSDISLHSSESCFVPEKKPDSSATSWVERKRTSKAFKTHRVRTGKENTVEGLSQTLDACLQAICSIPVLRQRLEPYVDGDNRECIISTMVQLAKHIDEGRLKMKDGCAILTDVALREKAIQVLMNYNLHWLKIGLHVVLGHGALIPKEKLDLEVDGQHQAWEDNYDTDRALIRLILEKHFLAHTGLAKYHATNKKIEGLYKSGYYEALGRVILKRFLLLVLTLDKAKCQGTLQIAFGIDGLDGGSPLLFNYNATLKSSRQVLQEFLLNAMHGEGDLIGHLNVLGYHVSHVQAALVEYKFEVRHLVDDLQDGVRLCRLAQVMLSDTSLLMKMRLPSNHWRRCIHNCTIALQRLAKAGVPIIDEQGSSITADDLVSCVREKALPLLWNIMVHLQIPMLISAHRLWEEIIHISGTKGIKQTVNLSLGNPTLLDLVLQWTQVVCATYGFMVRNFKTSFADGQAFCYLVNFYLPVLLPHKAIYSTTLTSPQKVYQGHMLRGLEETQVYQSPLSSQRVATIHNFGLVQDAVYKIGNIPEVLQVTDLIDGDPICSERNIIIFLAFLCSQLLGDISLIEKKISTLIWDAGVPSQQLNGNIDCLSQAEHLALQAKAATKIQSWWRALYDRQRFVKQRAAVALIQIMGRRLLHTRHLRESFDMDVGNSLLFKSCEQMPSAADGGLLINQSCGNIQVEAAVILIQAHFRGCVVRCKFKEKLANIQIIQMFWRARRIRNFFLLQRQACLKIQMHWRAHRDGLLFLLQNQACLKIQSMWRAYSAYKLFLLQRQSCLKIQRMWKAHNSRQILLLEKRACLKIQSSWRGFKIRHHFLHQKQSCLRIQQSWRSILTVKIAQREKAELHFAAVRIQTLWRGYFARWAFLKWREAAVSIQSCYRAHLHSTRYLFYRECVLKVQAIFRGRIHRRKYLKSRDAAQKIKRNYRKWLAWRDCLVALRTSSCQIRSAIKIQAAWRRFLRTREAVSYEGEQRQSCRNQLEQGIGRGGTLHYGLFSQTTAAVTIERFFRGHYARERYGDLKAMAALSVLEIQKCEAIPFCNSISSCDRGAAYVTGTLTDGLEGKMRDSLGRWVKMIADRRWFLRVRKSVRVLQRWWKKLLLHRLQSARVIQRHYHGWVERKRFLQQKRSATKIQTCWRGYAVRHSQGQMKQQQLSDLRMRMQNTAANVDNSMRLENRLTEALAALLTQRTVSGILHTCITIDLATQHSKLCCERLIAAGAIPKLLQLIQTTNRSPPHEEVLKLALSILSNLAHYPEFAKLVVDAPGSMVIIPEQLLRNKEEVVSNAMKLLHLVCKVPGGIDSIRKMPSILRRLHGLTQTLEKKVAVQARNLAQLPETAPATIRILAEKKMNEAILQHRSLVLLLQKATGEDLHMRLKAIKRMSSGMHQMTAPRLSMGRGPLQDCSNQRFD